MASLSEEILMLVEQLSLNDQKRVLTFVQQLSQPSLATHSTQSAQLPPGTPGKALLGLKLPLEDVEAMARALEDCEAVSTKHHHPYH